MWLTCDNVTYITKYNTYAVLSIRPVIFYVFYFDIFIDILFQFLIVHPSFILISVFLSTCKNYEVQHIFSCFRETQKQEISGYKNSTEDIDESVGALYNRRLKSMQQLVILFFTRYRGYIRNEDAIFQITSSIYVTKGPQESPIVSHGWEYLFSAVATF